MTAVFVGRQAIYDHSLRIYAYEFLYRAAREDFQAKLRNGDLATAKVLWTAFMEIGLDRISEGSFCFINLTKPFITGELPLPLPGDRVVVEVLEDVLPTPDVLAGVKRLKEQGVKVALDDYVHHKGIEPLIELADYVKIDLRAQDRDETRKLCDMFGAYDLKLLAEKVETMEELEFCKELEFDYYQGFFLTRPEIVEGYHVPPNQTGLLRILARLLDPDVELEEVSDLVSQDASLAYNLLRHVNSALYAPRKEITAIQQAIVRLGLVTIRKIVSLFVLIEFDDRPGDLLTLSLVRAKMCQELAERTGQDEVQSYFTVGLLSTLDALARAPLDKVLEHLPLSIGLRLALLQGVGPMGDALACAKAYEAGDWEHVRFGGLDAETLSQAYLHAVEYCQEVWGSLPHWQSH